MSLATAREALGAVQLTEAEQVELGRIENAIAPRLAAFDGRAITWLLYASVKAAPQGEFYIDPSMLPSADRLVCLFRYRRQRDGWNVDMMPIPEKDAYGKIVGLAAYAISFEPSARALDPQPAPARIAAPAVHTGAFTVTDPWFGEEFALPARPTLSVIFGTYNRIEHLKRAVASIRRAARKIDYEIICCDGGSTDGSRRWLAEQVDIVLIGERRLEGAVRAFNQCFAASRGKYVANLNDDCVVQGEALSLGVQYLEEHPKAGQVAFAFRGEGEDWHVNEIYEPKNYPGVTWPTTYANFGIIRRSVAEQAAAISGGFWNPIYKTYAADCELSAWVWKLGHRVDKLLDLRVLDTRAEDGLRASNARNSGIEAKRMYARWPAAAFKSNGPEPRVSPEEIARFRAVRDGRDMPVEKTAPAADLLVSIVEMVGLPAPEEERRLRKIAPLLRALDPVEDCFPPRAQKLRPERVLHVSMGTDVDPQAGQVRALKKLGADGYREVRWYADYKPEAVAGTIFEAAQKLRPTLIFMQLQAKGVVDSELARQIRAVSDPNCVIATWCGDIADLNTPYAVDWQADLGRVVDLTLHSSYSHVLALRAAGVHNAAYLQIGYDEMQYRPPRSDEESTIASIRDKYDVCFLGSKYGDGDAFSRSMPRHDAAERDAVIQRALAEFGERFALFGRGWTTRDHVVPLSSAHEVYWISKIGLSVSLANFLSCYTSDRLHRILGCGTLALVRRFPMMSTYGLKHEQNCLVYEAPEEAVTLARRFTLPEAEEQRVQIAEAGALLARGNMTWDIRVLELLPLVDAARSARP